ncbi:MAG: peptidoglycan DD-metalloendopeptidase family protein, partial [Planctomycetota bacterium]
MCRLALLLSIYLLFVTHLELRAGEIAPPPVPITFEGTSPSPPFYERMALNDWLNFDADFTNRTGRSLYFQEGSATLLDEDGNVTSTRAITSSQLDNSKLVYPTNGDKFPSPFQKGWRLTNFGSADHERIESLIRDQSGRLVAAGWGFANGREGIYLTRSFSDGTPDFNFSDDGKQVTLFPNLDHVRGLCVATTPDRGYVVAGTGRNNGEIRRHMIVAKYLSDGSLDRSFDGDGMKSFVLGFESSECEAVVVDDDGRIVLGGYAEGAWGKDFVIARLTTSGRFDSSFGTAGATNLDFTGSSDDRIQDLGIDRFDRIVAVGSTEKDGVLKFAIARFHSSGRIDTSFNGDGKAAPNFFAARAEYAKTVAVDAFGGLVVGGLAVTDDGTHFAVARLTPSGVLDTNFDENGKVITPIFGIRVARVEDIVFDGARIVAAGHAHDGPRDWVVLAAYRADGSLDTTFNRVGITAMERSETRNETANAVVRGTDRKFYVGGYANPLDEDGAPTGLRFALTRFRSDGRLDTNFIVPKDARVTWRWPYHSFPRKSAPARFNVQLRFAELASPFYMSIRPQRQEQNHRPYIFPLGRPSIRGATWGIGACHGFDSAHRAHRKFHNGTHRNNQRYAYDISLYVGNSALDPSADASENESRYAYGERVIASADGLVVFASNGVAENEPGSQLPNVPGGGNMVRIDHGNGEFTMYAHMIPGSVTVTRGQYVEQGQVLGRVGNSGSSSGPHLHFQLMTLWDWSDNHPDGIPVYFKNVGFAEITDRN